MADKSEFSGKFLEGMFSRFGQSARSAPGLQISQIGQPSQHLFIGNPEINQTCNFIHTNRFQFSDEFET
jgi:hypothetical protein